MILVVLWLRDISNLVDILRPVPEIWRKAIEEVLREREIERERDRERERERERERDYGETEGI